jgi:type I restriction enzyme M protein
MRFEEFETEQQWWGKEEDGFNEREETEQAWKVSIDDIVARNYNLDIKNPHVVEQIIHDPEVLLAQYHTMQQDIADLRNQLKSILGEALASSTQGI